MTPEWLKSDKALNQESIVIFGTPIYFVDGMAKLIDIHRAYLSAGGTRDPDSCRPSEWKRRKSVKELVDFLKTEDEVYSGKNATVKVECAPEGDRGGLYVCRELAHDYAMWLDKRYAVAVLRAFDQLVSGKYLRAYKTAGSVAHRMLAEDHVARKARMEASGFDVDKVLCNMFFLVCGSDEPGDVNALMCSIVENEEVSPIFTRLMNVMETELSLVGEDYEAVSTAAYSSLPEKSYKKWSDFIKKFQEQA